MPGPITYSAIALLARDRIREMRDALSAKAANGQTFSDLEKQIKYLTEQAYDIMTSAQPPIEPPVTLYGPPSGDQVSKFLIMGAVGPDIPGYAAFAAEGQGWLRDTLHKGNPDSNREQILVGSTNLALSFWSRVVPLLAQEFSDTAIRNRAQKSMQAYVLGHFCHVASDVVAAPFVDNLEWRLGRTTAPARSKLSREQVIDAIDVAVADRIFRRGSETRGSDWVNWWPTPGQVPGAFFKAFKQAVEDTYGAGGVQPGLAAYEKARSGVTLPPLSEDLLKDGYATFRNIVDSGRAWDFWDWLGATWFMFLPPFVALPIAIGLPNGKDYFRPVKPAGYDDGKALYELIGTAFAVNAVVPVYYSIIANTSYLGAESEVIVGWVSAGVKVIAAVSFFATLGASKESLPLRSVFLIGLPLAMDVIHFIVTLVAAKPFAKGPANPRRLQLFVSTLIPLVLSLIFIALYWGFLHKGVEKFNDPEPERDRGEFVWRLVVWFLILVVIWVIVTLIVRTSRLPAATENNMISGQRHQLRLFDDTTLYARPAGTSPTLADLHYPSGRRELLKLWWDGAGAATVRSLRDRLEFVVGGVTVTVPAPLAPTKLSEFAQYLERNVKPGANPGGLKAELFFPASADVEDYELPAGLVFSDEGDAEDNEEDHDAKKAVPQSLKKSTEEPYVLYHAPKAHQSVRFDQQGATRDTDESTPQLDGAGTVSSVAGTRQIVLAPGPNVTRFTKAFRPGDLFEAPQGGAQRVVTSVDSDTALTVSTPFPGGLAAGTTFRRAAQDWRQPRPPAAPVWQVQAVQGDDEIQGLPAANSAFGALFRPGDAIVVKPGGALPNQTRTVVDILSDTRMVTSLPLDPPLNFPSGVGVPPPPLSAFERGGQEPENLFDFLASADDTLDSGKTVMNHAADLAALLCLSVTSQVLPADALAKGPMGTAHDLQRVYQVFRNWNLDRRRENEWKMLVLGGAVSEKRGDAAARDPALPPLPSDWSLLSPAGEQISNTLGWVNVLRGWVDMARRPDSDVTADMSFRPGAPTNRALSRAIAYLFDMHDPAP